MKPIRELDDLVGEFANKLQISRDRLSIQTGSKADQRRERARRRQARLAIEFAGLVVDRYNSQEDTEPIDKSDERVYEIAAEIQRRIENATAAELADDRRVLADLERDLADARK